MTTPTSLVGNAGSPGARWVRVALQINPFAYVGKNAPSTKFPNEAAYNAALVAELTKLGVGLIAITDHWRAQTARGLITACDCAGIVALPGFEANSSEGIHLLVVFPQDTHPGAVDAAIGGCGGTPQGTPGTPGRPFTDMVTEMTRRGALVIAAHANTESGLLGRLSGLPRAAMWRHEDLAAVAISPGVPLAPADQTVLDNLSPDYKRAHPLAVIHADDICHPARLPTDGATSWVKMSVSSLASLRVALRTPVTRVRTTDPTSVAHPSIKEIRWEGGFLGDLRLPLSESLTALIGGAGPASPPLWRACATFWTYRPLACERRQITLS